MNIYVNDTGFNYFISKPLVEDDLVALGNVYYSMTTKDVETPKSGIVLDVCLFSQLLEDDQRLSALILIKSLWKLNPDFQPSSVRQLLRNPLFTQNVEDARSLLTDNEICDVNELQKWYESGDKNFDKKDFEDLKNIVREFTHYYTIKSTNLKSITLFLFTYNYS